MYLSHAHRSAIPPTDCRWENFRGAGPGGQKKNKTSSAVRVTHVPTGMSATASESRSQAENKAAALRRLRHSMTLELRENVYLDRFELPADWDVRKLRTSPKSDQYLAVMGYVLDVLSACRWVVSHAAERLGTTTAQLVRFLQNDEKLLDHVNRKRAEVALGPLRSQ